MFALLRFEFSRKKKIIKSGNLKFGVSDVTHFKSLILIIIELEIFKDFLLCFYLLCTQASQFNTEGLTFSLVPGDVGKPTARSEKAVVNDGHCRWDIPVYETVKFLKDAKTGKVYQRIYHLIVSSTVSHINNIKST